MSSYIIFNSVIYDEDIRYATPEVKIGKHEWRCIVYRHPENRQHPDPNYGTRSAYQWRRAGQSSQRWVSSNEWPSYNHNDGLYSGLPKTLLNAFFEQRDDIARALGEEPSVSVVQDRPQDLPLFQNL